MKGWYGNKQKHSLASKGIKTANNINNWRTHELIELIAEVPIDWLWQFRHYKRGELSTTDWDDLSVEKVQRLEYYRDNIMQSERDNIDRLKEDILKNGLITPLQLEVGREDGRVCLGEGNHRIIALKELGYEKVPIIVTTHDFTFGGIEYFTDVHKTDYFPSYANPLNVFPELDGYIPHPKILFKEEYR